MPETYSVIYDPEPIARFRRVALEGDFSIEASTRNLTWLWASKPGGKGIDDILTSNFQAVWERGQSSWKPASAAHLARKEKLGHSPLTMVMTRRLYNSLTSPEGTGDSIRFGDANNYWYGVNAEAFRHQMSGWSYPEIHQFRGDRSGTVRPFMTIFEETKAGLLAFFGTGFRNRLREIHSRLGGRGATVS